ncbi:MAG: xanthine dehydrogenase family protein molybdopterin-binding subunit, partial [Proteobacteria bacterium]|nr:xanthine dehydrogenase family protein molybdopterin-binding subunit [Pseudomonadota bacterium]
MPKFGMGQSVSRKEDNRLVRGRAEYTDDGSLRNQAFSVVLRSPHAHAKIVALDTARARSAPGVLAALTAADAAAEGLGTQPCFAPTTNIDGSPYINPPHALLAGDYVRHVGDPVVFIAAETREQALEAADLVEVAYEILPAVTETAGAIADGAPQVWPEAPNNLCVHWAQSDSAAADAAFAKAAHVAKLELTNNRLVVNSMEARAALGAYDPDTGRYTLTTGTQGVSGIKAILANFIFHVPEESVRVITGDVGGGFGMKGQFYAEMGLVLWASKQIGRPVKWTSDRSEAFLSDIHGRDHATKAQLALDGDGHFLGLRVSTIANMGAYLSTVSVLIPCEACAGMHTGVYDIPAAYNEVRAVFTHSVPVDAYRGAGRPEAAYMIERLVDVAAQVSGIDATELRRRNYVKPEAMPYTTSLGLLYDSGEFARNMDEALAASDWQGAAARRAAARKLGKLRGIGMAYYIETCAGPTLGPEDVTLRVEDDRIVILIGTQSSGQGHETAFAQLVCENLGVDFEQVELITGDSDVTPPSMGTAGSRSLTIGGSALGLAAKDLIEKGRGLAEQLLEVAAADLEFADGAYTIAGTDRRG